MIAAVGLAMSALSTVSSLVENAASSVANAANAQPAQTFTPASAPVAKTKLNAQLRSVVHHAGAPIPKFEKQTQAHLLALQEKLQA